MLTPRSFTFFASADDLVKTGTALFSQFRHLAQDMAASYSAPRTLRLTLPPMELHNSEDFDVDLALRQRWYESAQEAGFRWINLPLRISGSNAVAPENVQIISDLLSRRPGLFSSVSVSAPADIPVASSLYAKICRSLSSRDYRGFANFRFGLGFNIREFTPFFPFSCGSRTAVSVALESLPLFRTTWHDYHDLSPLEGKLLSELVAAERSFRGALEGSAVAYAGADWSLAPLPNGDETVVGLVEMISGNPLGHGRSVATISELTGYLKKPSAAGVAAAGFIGVMLSVLEDDVLANRFRHQLVSVNDLLLYSTVCGCGLDMVPVSGDTAEAALADYAADTGTLAFRLNKPLGVRLLPIVTLKAGQETAFSHDFVCNSAVALL